MCGSVVTTEVGSLSFDDLTARDARALAALAAAQLPTPADQTDIRSAIEWFHARHPGAATLECTASWEHAGAHEVPWWCWFDDGAALFVPLGLDVCRDIDTMAAVAVREILRAHPGAAIARSTARSPIDDHFRKPVVALPGGGEVLVVPRFVVLAHRLLVAWGNPDIEGFLRGFDWIGRPLAEPEERPPYEVDDDDGGCAISFDDVVAHEAEAVIARLVVDLTTAPMVEAVVHEDRELVLVRTSDVAATRAWIDAWWAANADP